MKRLPKNIPFCKLSKIFIIYKFVKEFQFRHTVQHFNYYLNRFIGNPEKAENFKNIFLKRLYEV